LILKRSIIVFFIFSLLISNFGWAITGQIDPISPEDDHTLSHTDSDSMHHIVDNHHEGHECHLSAHLVGINSQALALLPVNAVQIYPSYLLHFTNRNLPPPNKPPRS